MTPIITPCTINDLETLQKISIETFIDTFAAYNDPKDLQDFLDTAYALLQLTSELNNPNTFFYFVHVKDELAGYLKLNSNDAQTEDDFQNGLEIQRIYIRKNHKKMGLGQLLFEKSKKVAKELNKDQLWLGVWEHNKPALAFYEKQGLAKHSQHDFILGDDVQTDFIFVLDL
ncbi:GNAT family N-acetyltransferase [Carnobacterium gallinarum]|uniref:GNAT family N-acetyltransferase n=1 Tax=Carnobacterium gallinarum TaxID=2749 RepID=UPI0005594EAE|nr:GNAT family N-acetyltransferase [Carnobacterium gallinarum]